MASEDKCDINPHFVVFAEWLTDLLFRYKHSGISIAIGPSVIRRVIIGGGGPIEL